MTLEMIRNATPTFQTAAEAAAWTEKYLHETLRKSPGQLAINTRPASEQFDDTKIHLSEIIDDCYLKPIHRLIGTARDYDEEESMHWAHTGLLYEAWVRAALRNSFPGRVKSNNPIPGMPEGCQGFDDLWWKDAWVVYDVKSKSIGIDGPTERDMRQVATYAAYRARHWGHPVFAVLVYTYRQDLSKLDCYPVEYEVEPTLTWAEANVNSIKGWVALAGTALPPKPVTADPLKFPCAFMTRDGMKTCAFYQTCWPDGPASQRAALAPEAVQAKISQHYAITRQKAAVDAQSKDLEKQLKALREELIPVFEEHGDLLAGDPAWGQNLKRIAYGPRKTYDIEAAVQKNPALGPMVEPYAKFSAGYSVLRYVKAK